MDVNMSLQYRLIRTPRCATLSVFPVLHAKRPLLRFVDPAKVKLTGGSI
jgi:hypothetical protein